MLLAVKGQDPLVNFPTFSLQRLSVGDFINNKTTTRSSSSWQNGRSTALCQAEEEHVVAVLLMKSATGFPPSMALEWNVLRTHVYIYKPPWSERRCWEKEGTFTRGSWPLIKWETKECEEYATSSWAVSLNPLYASVLSCMRHVQHRNQWNCGGRTLTEMSLTF